MGKIRILQVAVAATFVAVGLTAGCSSSSPSSIQSAIAHSPVIEGIQGCVKAATGTASITAAEFSNCVKNSIAITEKCPNGSPVLIVGGTTAKPNIVLRAGVRPIVLGKNYTDADWQAICSAH
jgi:hypothetical protein